jgi:hypothetical protein
LPRRPSNATAMQALISIPVCCQCRSQRLQCCIQRASGTVCEITAVIIAKPKRPARCRVRRSATLQAWCPAPSAAEFDGDFVTTNPVTHSDLPTAQRQEGVALYTVPTNATPRSSRSALGVADYSSPLCGNRGTARRDHGAPLGRHPERQGVSLSLRIRMAHRCVPTRYRAQYRRCFAV